MAKNTDRFLINIGLVLSGIASMFSGLLIQIKYHMGNHGNISTTDYVLGFKYQDWSSIHKISIVILSLLMIYHVCKHWKWYKAVVSKRLFSRNLQVLILTILFIAVAITGLTPWFIDMLNGDQMQRKIFIELHDKLTLFLVIFLTLHILTRLKWFYNYLSK
jgi:hypothetical protein